jgi:hypothetical protein
VTISGSKKTGGRYATVSQRNGRWQMVGPPRWLRFPTGGWREKGFLTLLVCVTAYLLVMQYVPGPIPTGPPVGNPDLAPGVTLPIAPVR